MSLNKTHFDHSELPVADKIERGTSTIFPAGGSGFTRRGEWVKTAGLLRPAALNLRLSPVILNHRAGLLLHVLFRRRRG